MFRNYLICMFLSVWATAANSQSTTLGFQAGVNLSNLTYDDALFVEDFNAFKPGFVIGGNFTIHVSQWIGVGAELNVERKGTEYELDVTDDNGEPVSGFRFYNHLDYLSLPFFIQLSVGHRIRGLLQLGTSFHLLLQQTNELKNEEKLNLREPYPRHEKDLFNQFDQSVFAGLGIILPVSGYADLKIQSRASYGLTPIDASNAQSSSKNVSYALTAGLQVLLNTKRR